MEKKTFYITIGIAVAVLIILLIALLSGSSSASDRFLPDHLDSCPKDFSPHPVILVSFDGFRADYLERGVTPTLNEMRERGSSALYMTPSYPSSTFPNHYTMVTGLYPESHGIVSNVFYDPENNRTFDHLSDTIYEGRWFRAEPIWITAKRNNLSSATLFWPGSEAEIGGERPTYWSKYEADLPLKERVDQVFQWLDLPSPLRPSWISIYSRQPDYDGHQFGPDSDEVTKSVEKVDAMMNYLLTGLIERNLLSCVNIIVVSDHGMTATDDDKIIRLEDFIPEDLWDKIFVNYSRITFRKHFEGRKTELEKAISCKRKEYQLFRREELPKRMHYSGNKLNGDYVFVLEDGYTVSLNKNSSNKGTHGYENHKISMQALFLAYGPAFKKNFQVKPFQNVELYNLMCHLLNIPPGDNNGTEGLLDLMLKDPTPISPMTLTKPSKTRLVDEAEWRQNYLESDCQKNDTLIELSVKLLNMSDELISTIERKETPWGSPLQTKSRSNFTLLFHPDHITGYSFVLKLPLWTSFAVDRAPSARRDAPPQWTTDVRLKSQNSPSCHVSEKIPHNDLNLILTPLFQPEFSVNETTKLLSFLLSDGTLFSAQLTPRWNDLTLRLLPEWLTRSDSPLNVVLGPIFDHDTDGLMDEDIFSSNNVAIPTDYFAVVTRCTTKIENLEDCPENDIDSLTFIYPQKLSLEICYMKMDEFALLFSAKIRDVEDLTGLTFFSNFAPRKRLELITKEYHQLW